MTYHNNVASQTIFITKGESKLYSVPGIQVLGRQPHTLSFKQRHDLKPPDIHQPLVGDLQLGDDRQG